MSTQMMTDEQLTMIDALVFKARSTIGGQATTATLGAIFLNQVNRDFMPMLRAIGGYTHGLTAAEADQLISLLQTHTPDQLIGLIAQDQTLLNLFGINTADFWTWMMSNQGEKGMTKKKTLLQAQTKFANV